MRTIGLIALLFALFVGVRPLTACLNDEETPIFEEEFQEQYEPDQEEFLETGSSWNLAGIGAGGTLLGAAAVVVFLRRDSA